MSISAEEDLDAFMAQGEDKANEAVAEGEPPAEPVVEAEPDTDLAVSIEGVTPTPEDDILEDDADVPDEGAPEWVKKTRTVNKELRKRIKELEAEKSAAPQTSPTMPQTITLGAKPTMEACDYDAEKLTTELEAWLNRKAAYDADQKVKQDAATERLEAWRKKNTELDKAGQRFKGFADAKTALTTIFDENQRGMLLDAAVDPSTVVAALGRNPAKARELAAIKNPVQFIAEIARLETKMTIEKRAPTTKPETALSGSGRSPVSTQANLDRLKKQADETGDFSEYLSAKRAIKAV